MPSARYSFLRARIAQLKEHLLPAEFDPTGIYEDTGVGIRALAFRVLAHAEIEAYLEDRVIEIAKTAWKSWEADRLVSATAMCLLAFSGREMKRPPETYAAPKENQKKGWPSLIDVHHRLSDAVSQYVREITLENHGIREKNILSMLLPLGLDHQKIDAVFLADIDDFGQQRGKAAHTSSAQFVNQGIDPKIEYNRVNSIVSNLENVDDQMDGLLQEASSSARLLGL